MNAEQLFVARIVGAALTVAIALVVEARTSKIPNALTFPAWFVALALRTGGDVREQLLGWLGATLIGLVPGYLAYRRGNRVRRSIGAGAIKLVASTCAFMTLAGAAATTAAFFAVGWIMSSRHSDSRNRSTPVVALAAVVGSLVSWLAR